MNEQEVARKIQAAFPEVCWEVQRDIPLILTRHNPRNPEFPVKVCIFEDEGIFIDFGKDCLMFEMLAEAEEAIGWLEKIFRDQLVAALGYKKPHHTMPSRWECFDLTDEEDREEYQRLLAIIRQERRGLGRLNPYAWQGKIVTSDWSGSRFYKVHRP